MQLVIWHHGERDIEDGEFEEMLPESARLIPSHGANIFLVEIEDSSTLREVLHPSDHWTIGP